MIVGKCSVCQKWKRRFFPAGDQWWITGFYSADFYQKYTYIFLLSGGKVYSGGISMCIIYLYWKQDGTDLKAEVQHDALEVLMKRHFIQMNGSIKRIDNYSMLKIVSDNLSRLGLCCFGHHQDVYFHNKFVEQKQGLSLMPLPHDTMMEQSEHIRVQCERERRWNLLDADEWISFFQDVVKAVHSIGLVYFNEPFDRLFSLDGLSQQSLLINNLTADTLLYLDPGVRLVIHDETMH